MFNKPFIPLVFVTLLVWPLAPGQRLRAGAINVIVDFSGSAQSFTGTGVGSGNLIADGGGAAEIFSGGQFKVEPFVVLPPVNHAVTVLDDFTSNEGAPVLQIKSTPTSIRVDVPVEPPTTPPTTKKQSVTRFDFQDGHIADIRDMDLNISNGKAVPFALSQVVISTNSNNIVLKAVPIDIVGDVVNLKFDQTGDASLVPTGPGVGTFSLPGELSLGLAKVKALLFEVVGTDIDPQTLSSQINLTGTYKITGPQKNAKIELDGSAASIPYMISTHSLLNLVFGDDFVPLTVQGTIDVVVTMNLDFAIHLAAANLVIPEPGSIVLLGIGMVICSLAGLRLRYLQQSD